jgi:uncharacterized small protein (DUF1192 family)
MNVEVIGRGDTRRLAVDEMQNKIAALEAEAGQLAQGHFPLEEIRQRARAHVESIRAGHSAQYNLATLKQPGNIRLLGAQPGPEDLQALEIERVGPDEYAESLVQATLRDGHEPGLSSGERSQRIAAIEREIAALTIAEEKAALAIEAEHVDAHVLRREAVPAELVLEAWSAAL